MKLSLLSLCFLTYGLHAVVIKNDTVMKLKVTTKEHNKLTLEQDISSYTIDPETSTSIPLDIELSHIITVHPEHLKPTSIEINPKEYSVVRISKTTEKVPGRPLVLTPEK